MSTGHHAPERALSINPDCTWCMRCQEYIPTGRGKTPKCEKGEGDCTIDRRGDRKSRTPEAGDLEGRVRNVLATHDDLPGWLRTSLEAAIRNGVNPHRKSHVHELLKKVEAL